MSIVQSYLGDAYKLSFGLLQIICGVVERNKCPFMENLPALLILHGLLTILDIPFGVWFILRRHGDQSQFRVRRTIVYVKFIIDISFLTFITLNMLAINGEYHSIDVMQHNHISINSYAPLGKPFDPSHSCNNTNDGSINAGNCSIGIGNLSTAYVDKYFCKSTLINVWWIVIIVETCSYCASITVALMILSLFLILLTVRNYMNNDDL